MALMLPNSVFIHIRKTGGTWVRSAIAAAGIPTEEVGEEHSTYAQIKHLIGDRKVFSFIRHPLSLLKSYWAFRTVTFWPDVTNEPGSIEANPCGDLHDWLEWVCDKHPGYVGKMYANALPPKVMLFRSEEATVRLVQILRYIGHPLSLQDAQRICLKPRENVTNSDALYVPKRIRELVTYKEQFAINLWKGAQS